MNAQAIIDTIRETRPDMQGILDALEDGAALVVGRGGDFVDA